MHYSISIVAIGLRRGPVVGHVYTFKAELHAIGRGFAAQYVHNIKHTFGNIAVTYENNVIDLNIRNMVGDH